MVVRFTPKWTQAQIRTYITQQVGNIDKAILSRLQRVGETFVSNARANGTYNDITGNLRSSIGYIVLKDGVQISGGFPGERGEGLANGKRVAREAAERLTSGYALVVVAGMDYASAVESRGKDVITGSSKIAENDLKQALRSLQNKLT